MLTELQIRNFLIIESLNLSFLRGMSVITGETGAGKSILLDALQFVVGARADAKLVRQGKETCEVNAEFILQPDHAAHLLLSEWGIEVEEGVCILRRVLNNEGRSKGYINGQIVGVQQLKLLGELLLNWVGQYEHQALLQQETQIAAVDVFAKDEDELAAVIESGKRLQELNQVLASLQEQAQQQQQSQFFKREQLQSLEELGLQEQEWETLQQEHKKLAASGELLGKISEMLGLLRDEEANMLTGVKKVEKDLSQLAASFTELKNAADLVGTASVSLLEAYHELKAFYDSLDLDPERLQEVEARLASIHGLARKLQVPVEGLFQYQQDLAEELKALGSLDTDIKTAAEALANERIVYLQRATALSKLRQQAAVALSAHVNREIKTLGMKEAEFVIEVKTDSASFALRGQDQVEMRVRMNPGQKWSSLKEGASGGELSRIALVIAVVNARQNQAETLIFDEVDVGVSGAVAEKVGSLLKQLGERAQVLCITHLPQVAMLGEQHIHVAKIVKDGQTFGDAKTLDFEERVEEVARIMSGESITEHARHLARAGLQERRLTYVR